MSDRQVKRLITGKWRLGGRPNLDRVRRGRRSWSLWSHPTSRTRKPGRAQSFLQAIRSSAVLSEKQFEKVEANVAEGNYPPEPAELASRLVKDGVLTAFQARQILKGKSQGLVFGRYVILDFLGKGAMGRVYRACHRMMGRVVALKVLDPRCVADRRRSPDSGARCASSAGWTTPTWSVPSMPMTSAVPLHRHGVPGGADPRPLVPGRGPLPPADVVGFAPRPPPGWPTPTR